MVKPRLHNGHNGYSSGHCSKDAFVGWLWRFTLVSKPGRGEIHLIKTDDFELKKVSLTIMSHEPCKSLGLLVVIPYNQALLPVS